MLSNLLLDSATISCFPKPQSERFAFSHRFSQDRTNLGWDLVGNATMYGVSGGFYFLTATTPEPYLTHGAAYFLIDASQYTELQIQFAYSRGQYSTASKGRIYFTTSNDPIINVEKSAEFVLISDGDIHQYRISFKNHSKWVGFITNIRVSFATDGRANDQVYLEAISLGVSSFSEVAIKETGNPVARVYQNNFLSLPLGSSPADWQLYPQVSGKTLVLSADGRGIDGKCLELASTVATAPAPIATYAFPVALRSLIQASIAMTGSSVVFRVVGNNASDPDVVRLLFDIGTSTLKYFDGATYQNFSPVIRLAAVSELTVFCDGESRTSRVRLQGSEFAMLRNLSDYQPAKVQLQALTPGISSVKVFNFSVQDYSLLSDAEIAYGRRGEVLGDPVVSEDISIMEGLNDELIINLDGYGDVPFKLRPHLRYSPHGLAEELSRVLSAFGVGGYLNAEAIYDQETYRFRIRSGSVGIDSTVSVTPGPLAELLGFCSANRNPTGVYSTGVEPLEQSFWEYVRPATKDLLAIRGGDFDLRDKVDRSPYVIGDQRSLVTGTRNLQSGLGRTVIDLTARAKREALITKVVFNGTVTDAGRLKLASPNGRVNADGTFSCGSSLPAGVSSKDLLVIQSGLNTGTYSFSIIDATTGLLRIEGAAGLQSQTSAPFQIQSCVKVKLYRPHAGGELREVYCATLDAQIPGRHYSLTRQALTATVSWHVKPGDMLGIFNATSFPAGFHNSQQTIRYLSFNGEVSNCYIDSALPQGEGFDGVGLVGMAAAANSLRLDITLATPVFAEDLVLNGKPQTISSEINVLAAVGNGVSVVAQVTGTHTLVPDEPSYGSIASGNVAVNVSALSDGILLPENSAIGNYLTDSPDGTYFYITGDSELTGPGLVALPNPGPTGWVYAETRDYTTDPYTLRFIFAVSQSLHRVRICFKDFPNSETFYFSWLGDSNFNYIGKGYTKEFTTVSLDNVVIPSSDYVADPYIPHHYKPIFAMGLNTFNDPSNLEGYSYYLTRPYKLLDKSFTPLSTTEFRYTCLEHQSTKISEVELYTAVQVKRGTDCIPHLSLKLPQGALYSPVLSPKGEQVFTKVGFPIIGLTLEQNLDSSVPLTGFMIGQEAERSYGKVVGISEQGNAIPLVLTNHFDSPAEVAIAVEEMIDPKLVIATTLSGRESVFEPKVGPTGLLCSDISSSGLAAINSAPHANGVRMGAIDLFSPALVSQEVPIPYLSRDDASLEGILFGSNAEPRSLGDGYMGDGGSTSAGGIANLFIKGSETLVPFAVSSALEIWRIFGSISGSEISWSGLALSGILLNEVQCVVDGGSSAVPDVVKVLQYTGGDPTLSGSWSALTTCSSLASAVPDSEGNITYRPSPDYQHISLSGVMVSGIKLVFSSFRGLSGGETALKSIVFSPEDRIDPMLYTVTRTASTVHAAFSGGCPDTVALKSLGNLFTDPRLGDCTFFSLTGFSGTNIDVQRSFFEVGTSGSNRYQWALVSGVTDAGILRFQVAEAALPDLKDFLYNNSALQGAPKPNFRESSLEYVGLRLSRFSPGPFNASFSGIDAQRQLFDPTLHMGAYDSVVFELSSLDLNRACIELDLEPDFDSAGWLPEDWFTADKKHKVFVLWSLVNDSNEFISLIFESVNGFRLVLRTEELIEDRYLGNVDPKNTKLRLTWDTALPQVIFSVGGTEVFKGQLHTKFSDCGRVRFSLGGGIPVNALTTSDANDRQTSYTPKVLGACAKVSNLTVFSSFNPAPVILGSLVDKLSFSRDGINYRPFSDNYFTLGKLAPGESVTIWVKSAILDKKTILREGALKCRWEVLS